MPQFIGGSGNDTLGSTSGDDELQGLAGNDYLDGGEGNDTLLGGDGDDRLDGRAGNDRLLGGGGGWNHLAGGDGDDWLDAGTNGWLEGGAGNDTLEAGQLGYQNDPAGVIVNLSGTARTVGGRVIAVRTAIDGYGGLDTLGATISGGWGSNHADWWYGPDVKDQWDGVTLRAGDDVAVFGAGNTNIMPGSGTDDIDGGDGWDTLSYNNDDGGDSVGSLLSGVTIDLNTGQAKDPWGATDTFRNIEAAEGSRLPDRLTGNELGNYLAGADGSDTLIGWGGDDTLQGGPGNDSIDGGPGVDTLQFNLGANGAVDIDFANTGAVGLDGNDTLAGIERYEFNLGRFNDTVRGSGGMDRLNGNDGNDVLRGLGAADEIYGGVGNDTLDGGDASDFLQGDDGDDSLLGGNANDTLRGGAGNDRLDGGAGYDTAAYEWAGGALEIDLAAGTARGAEGSDTLIGIEFVRLGAFDDTASGSAAHEVLLGEGGNDSLRGLGGNDALHGDNWGGQGEDTLTGGGGNDTLRGEGGRDTAVYAGNQADYVFRDEGWRSRLVDTNLANGEEGTDILYDIEVLKFADRTLTILRGTDQSETLDLGAAGAQLAIGSNGDDIYLVAQAADTVFEPSENGVDTVHSPLSWTLSANVEHLVLTGNAATNGVGNLLGNTITGTASANRLEGRGGNDTLSGAAGVDTLIGGGGNDIYVVTVGDVVTELAGNGIDRVQSAIGWTLGDHLEVLELIGDTAINGTGNAGANTLIGNARGNALSGAGGADWLSGMEGSDTLRGGAGSDALRGGDGGDVFVFDTALSTVSNLDSLMDFTVGEDRLQLDKTVFTALATGALPATAFVADYGLTSARDADDRIIYERGGGSLYYDADGVGGVAAVQFASFQWPWPEELNAASFVIVA